MKVQGFSCDKKILMSLWSLLAHLQNRVSVFWNSNFESMLLGKRKSCPWNHLHFLRKSDKRLLSPKQQKKKSETRFCRRKIAKDDNVKINVSKNITCAPFCSSKLVYFFKFSFWENQVLNFALIDEWNVNNSIEKVKVYFSIVFYDKD